MRRSDLPGLLGRRQGTSTLSEAARLARRGMRVVAIAALFLALSGLAAQRANAGGGTLTVGMTAGDIPVTTGNPDQGFEGYRFVGYNLYDALVLWDLSKADKPLRHQARPRDLLGDRPERPQALDRASAPRRHMA